MDFPKRYLVTSALPYTNGPPHIGHLAGAYLSADIFVRFLRLMGKDVVFVCGSDEHGAAITMRALKEGKSPKEITDTYHELFKNSFAKLGISFDIYHRTTEALHHETAQSFFRTLYEKGEFIEKESEQYFDEEAKQFLADRYIIGTCPKCGHEEAYGDQCENCGSSLSPTELIHPRSTLSGAKPVLKRTVHWYLPLDRYESWLREWITTGSLDGVALHDPAKWKNHVVGQCTSWLDGGLKPRAMTRDLDWGVDVPSEVPGSDGKKLYVWMDAPIGYVSATKQWALDHDRDWKPYWQDRDTALIHFIGKDNIVFHCLIFPAILRAHGDYILPRNVPANQFVNLEGRKISTSKNWAVWIHEYVEDLDGRADELRYHMTKYMPEQKDSEFTWKGFQESVNNELVNNLANFIHRVLVLTHKYYDGKVPAFDADQGFTGASDPDWMAFHDSEMLQLHDDLQALNASIRDFDFRSGLSKLMEISAKGNQLLQFNEPWKNHKEDPQLVRAVMNLALQIVAAISVACRPFLPFASDKLRAMLNLPTLSDAGEYEALLNDLAEGNVLMASDHEIQEAKHLFTRIDDKVVQAQIDKLHRSEVEPENESEAVVKATISYEDFAKLDMRVGTIVEAQKVPKADKLLQLTVDLGFEKRTVVSGVAQQYAPEEVIGKQVTLLANLAPRTMRGVESQGMILMAEDRDGRLSFVASDDGVENGSTIS